MPRSVHVQAPQCSLNLRYSCLCRTQVKAVDAFGQPVAGATFTFFIAYVCPDDLSWARLIALSHTSLALRRSSTGAIYPGITDAFSVNTNASSGYVPPRGNPAPPTLTPLRLSPLCDSSDWVTGDDGTARCMFSFQAAPLRGGSVQFVFVDSLGFNYYRCDHQHPHACHSPPTNP